MGWWRVKVSSGCPLAGRLAAVEQEARSGGRQAERGTDARPARPDERPPAPWGNVPLAELVILAGIVSLAIGGIGRHPTAIGLGVALAGLGGMEVAIREHFAGYRSHTTLLAGAVFVFTVGWALLPGRPDPGRRPGRRGGGLRVAFYLRSAAHSSAPPGGSATASAECAAEPGAGASATRGVADAGAGERREDKLGSEEGGAAAR